MRILIFTDLDGSLLNHDDYSYEAALPALEKIKAANIPLIIVTSKTRGEVEPLQRELDISAPFIVENGGGIFFPESPELKNPVDGEKVEKYTVLGLGATYRDIRKFFAKVASRFSIRGFGDMTAAEIANLTGLPEIDVELARRREFTEPFLAENESDIGKIEKLALLEGLKITKGGRFFHLIGLGQDKGIAVKKVIDIYRNNGNQETLVTIGIGDSENDLPMLQQVDIPVLIPRLQQGLLHIELPGLVRANAPGCRGWNSAVGCILDNLAGGYLPDKVIPCP
ncbi:MAG: HAD-IIB family hydrolase [Syntrophales bacterium]